MNTKYTFMCPDQISAISEVTLNSFLENFNYLAKKYMYEDISNKKTCFPSSIIDQLTEYEEMNRYGELVKQKYSSIIENLRLVYNDQDLIEKDIRTYHLVEENIVHKYLAIPQLDRLFDEDYFNFEWDMYVGQNLQEHKSDYYRDHFIHEVRNLYMMDVLLDKFSLYEASKKILSNPQKSKISAYTTKKAKQFIWNDSSAIHKLFNNIQGNFKAAISSFNLETYTEQYFYRYVIYASAYLSALFHDLGYPICHFLGIRHRLSSYNPSLYMFTHNSVESFDQIAAKLNDSLLFTVVSLNEIKKRTECDKDGKYDHGVYSALAFLFQFYESGLIYKLSPEKQCAIELAALAIYNHTASYNCIKWESGNHYNRPYFDLNPISFLLRICDDLQEWDRRYFEITDDSDLLVCNNCKTPRLAIPNQNSVGKFGEKHFEFSCACGSTKASRHESFLKRKIYVVRTSDTLDAQLIKDNVLKLTVNYDLYRLLKMARINSNYAKHRAKELKKTKQLLQYQNIMQQSGIETCPTAIYLDYFISSNPILIKTKIFERYWSDQKPKTWNRFISSEGKEFASIYDSGKTIFKESYRFYSKLLSIAKLCRSKRKIESYNARIRQLIDTISNCDDQYKAIVSVLVNDCLMQYAKEKPDNIEYSDFINDSAYYKQYISDNDSSALVYDCIDKYCYRLNSFNEYKTNSSINYYGDLYLFSWFNKNT